MSILVPPVALSNSETIEENTPIITNQETDSNYSIIENFPLAKSDFWINDTEGTGDAQWIQLQANKTESYTMNFTYSSATIRQPEFFNDKWQQVPIINETVTSEYREMVLGNLTGMHYMRIDLYIGQDIRAQLLTYTGQHPEITSIPEEEIQMTSTGQSQVTITGKYLGVELPQLDNWYLEVERDQDDITSFQPLLPDGTPIVDTIQDYTDNNNNSRRVVALQNFEGLIIFNSTNGIGTTFNISIGDHTTLHQQIAMGYQIPQNIPINTVLEYSEGKEECSNPPTCSIYSIYAIFRSFTLFQDLPDFADLNILDTWKGTLIDASSSTDMRKYLPIHTVFSDNTTQFYNYFLQDEVVFKKTAEEINHTGDIAMNFNEAEFIITNSSGFLETRSYKTAISSEFVRVETGDRKRIKDFFGLFYNITQERLNFGVEASTDYLQLGLSGVSQITLTFGWNNMEKVNFFADDKPGVLSQIYVYEDGYPIQEYYEKERYFDYLVMPTILTVGNDSYNIQNLLNEKQLSYTEFVGNFERENSEFVDDLWHEYQSNETIYQLDFAYQSSGVLNSLVIKDQTSNITEINYFEPRHTPPDSEETTTTTTTDNPETTTSESSQTSESVSTPNPIDTEESLLSFASWMAISIIAVPMIRSRKTKA